MALEPEPKEPRVVDLMKALEDSLVAVKNERKGRTEDAVTCECGHDLSQHTQEYWAPCNVDGCECWDFTINEEMERKEI